MAKKRKASAGAPSATQGDADLESSKRFKLNVNSWTDVADSEDEWDLSRDKILLDEGPVRERQRQAREYAEELEDSADEVLDVPDDDDDDGGMGEDDGAGAEEYENEDEDENEGWGADEAYGADVAENEEDAREIEQEAIRLQRKRLQALTDADFGFDEAEWLGQGGKGQDADGVRGSAAAGRHVEKLPEIEVSDDMPVEERQRILQARYPEFELLAKELLELQPLAAELEVEAKKAASREESGRQRAKSNSSEIEVRLRGSVAKYNALAGYMATLAMYFAVFTSNCAINGETAAQSKPVDPKELRNHSIMDSLMRSRALWEQVRDLGVASDMEDEDMSEPEIKESDDLSQSDEATFYTPKASPTDKLKKTLPTTRTKNPPKSKTPTAADKAALKARAEATTRRAAQLRKLDEDMAILNASLPTSKRSKSTTKSTKISTQDGDDSDFGDETALTSHEAAEKARRKKTLRFYTSQIAQKVKKGEAARENGGGDADLPYRERLKDRVARLNAEAEARGRKKGDKAADELDGNSGDEDDRALAAEIREEADGDDDGAGEDYYQTIASRTSAKKQSDKLRREAQKEAALRGASVREVETVGEDGKRAIGYTIEKNKGLMAHRKKSVRNPRVKKKEAYEKKKKRLSSVKQVYKGGEGRGGYGGELTGIKKGVVRAVKL